MFAKDATGTISSNIYIYYSARLLAYCFLFKLVSEQYTSIFICSVRTAAVLTSLSLKSSMLCAFESRVLLIKVFRKIKKSTTLKVLGDILDGVDAL